MKAYSLLSRDGQIHSCNPYVKMELQYNEEATKPAAAGGENCNSANPENAPFSPKVETPPSGKRHKFTRSISLLHDYEQFKRNQLKNTAHCNDIDKLDLAQTRPHVHEQHDKTDDSSSPSSPLSFKHEISTTAQTKVMWHTRNPEFNELFLFHVTKEKLTSAFLLVSVMDKEILTKDTCIGYTTVPLGTLSITGVQSIPPQWFTIKKVFKDGITIYHNIWRGFEFGVFSKFNLFKLKYRLNFMYKHWWGDFVISAKSILYTISLNGHSCIHNLCILSV